MASTPKRCSEASATRLIRSDGCRDLCRGGAVWPVLEAKFSGDDDPGSFERRERLADEFFIGEWAVDFGRIKNVTPRSTAWCRKVIISSRVPTGASPNVIRIQPRPSADTVLNHCYRVTVFA